MRCTSTALGFAALLLVGCGDEGPPVVQVSGGAPAAQALQAQIINLQNQVSTLQQRMAALDARLAPTK